MATGTLTYTVTASDGSRRTRTLPLTRNTGGGGTALPNVMLVPMENEGFDITSATKWPKASVLASQYAYLTQFYGLAHPSQPNYLHLVSGSNQGITTDALTHTLTAPCIFDQLTTAGVPWCTYAEGLSLAANNYSDGLSAGGDVYIPRHNIISAFNAYNPTNAKVKDSGATSSIGTAVWTNLVNDLNSTSYPNFVYFAPSAANQGHGTGSPYKDPTTGPWASTAKDADNFISKFTTTVQATKWYRDGGTIIFLWDEGANSDTASGFTTPPLTGNNGGGKTNFLVISAAAAGKGAVAGLMNAWGLLGDIQDAYHITTPLGQSQGNWGTCRNLWSPRV